MRYLVLLAWMCVGVACSRAPREEAGSGLRITFEVDSIRIYPLDGLSPGKFVFSPTGEPNTVWMLGTPRPFRLHLLSGQQDTIETGSGNPNAYPGYLSAGQTMQERFPPRSTFELLIPCGSCTSIQDDSITWIHSGRHLFFSASKSTYDAVIRNYSFPDDVFVRYFRADPGYLYILFNKYFAIISKDYLFRTAPEYDYQSRKIYPDILSAYQDYAGAAKRPLEEWLAHSDSIKSIFLNSGREDAQRFAGAVDHSFLYALFDHYAEAEIERMILKRQLPAPYLTPVLVELTGRSVRRVDLQKALYYQSLIRTDPDSVQWGFRNGIKCVQEVQSQFEQLAKTDLPEDEKLFRRAEIKKELLRCGWFGETGYDYTIVHRTYDSLLRFFPESQWADNAAFALRQFGMQDEGHLVFSERALSAMRKFIADYPQSELLADAHFGIVDLYSNYYHDEPNTQYKHLIRGLEELKRMKSLFNQIDTSGGYRQRLHYLQERLSGTAFEVSGNAAKSVFSKGEDLLFHIRVKNRIADPVFFKVFREAPHFRTYFFSRDKEAFQFVPDAVRPGPEATRTIKLLPGEELEFSAAVNQAVRHGERGVAGKYVILKPARFYISFQSPDSKINTGQMAIGVE